MNINMLKKLVILDWILGIKRRWLYYVIAIIIFIIEIGYFISRYYAFRVGGTITSQPGVIDCILFVFNGSEEYKIESGLAFNIPSLWLLLNLFSMYVVGYYPIENLKKYSAQILIRCNNRVEYWISKIIWCIFTVVIFCLLLFVIATIFVVFLGDFSVLLHNDICENIMGINTENMTILRLLTPFLILLMMAIVQVNFSILLSPVTANLIMVIYMVCSVYYSNNFFVYNYCMYSRIFPNSADNIIALVTALIFSLLLLIISSVLALKKSSKIDIC